MASAQDSAPGEAAHVRQPLPSQEEIAQLPPDGGEEFNRLIFEQSPYLLQHARNPVDWHAWGEAAFQKAKEENKPIFLSIGYTTCHWCHVMEHESFEDEEVAALINANYIPVKVDREERPDIDEVYMAVTQGMTGGGGWPMTVIMTPDKLPFFAGTYFPKEDVPGRSAGIKTVLTQLSEAWKTKQEEVAKVAASISDQLQQMSIGSPGGAVSQATLGTAYQQYQHRFDPTHGGFGRAPKFPIPGNHLFLLRYWKRTGEKQALAMVEKTLTEIHQGGVYDQVGYGIHRYSTDAEWLVPHFEKMLYDQAQTVMAAVEAYQATGDEDFARLAREILTYVQRDMTAEEGGFYSAEDADSEGEEGKFYVWTVEEIKDLLGEADGNFFIQTHNIKPGGNFRDEATRQLTGTSIPHLTRLLTDEERTRLEPLRQKLFATREGRVHPQKDDKILTDWNGLMIAAFAQAGTALDQPEYIAAAKKAADFVLSTLSDESGRLVKRYRLGEAGLPAHLEDYAFTVWGLLNLYEATFELPYLEHAVRLNDLMLEHFWDEEHGGFFTTADDSEELLVRAKRLFGSGTPSGNAIGLLNLVRLHRMTANTDYETKAQELVAAFSAEIEQQPSAYPMVLVALEFLYGESYEIVIAAPSADSEDTHQMLQAIREPYLPNKVLLFRPDGDEDAAKALTTLAPYTAGQASKNGKATAYVCRNFACQLPTTDLATVRKNLNLPLAAE